MTAMSTPDGKKFASSDVGSRKQDVEKGDELLSLINDAKASYEIKRNLRGVINGINRNFTSSNKTDYFKGSFL